MQGPDNLRLDPALAGKVITPETTIDAAGAIWIARLATAGLDVEDFDDEFDALEQENQRHHANRTVQTYALAFELFARWLDRNQRTTVGSIQPDDLVQFARTLRRSGYDLSKPAEQKRSAGEPVERLAPRTVHSYVRPLMGFLTLLEHSGAISFRVVVVQVELRRVLPRLPTPMAPTPPDLRRLVNFYDRPRGPEGDRSERLRLIRLRNAALLHLLFSSAARISEALGLSVGDVMRDRRVLGQTKVKGKGRKEGTIFIRAHAERSLRIYLEARGFPKAAAPLFESLDRRTAGARLSRSSGWRIVHEAATTLASQIELEGKYDEAALLRETSPHTFRHFVGYYLLNEGVSLAEVSQILRHSTVDVTRGYYASYRDLQLQEVHDQFSPDPLNDER